MKAVVINEYGGAEKLSIQEVALPIRKKNELLIEVKATALNRADIMQRQGKYPPPKGITDIMGLELAGIVEEASENSKFKVGDKVFGLIPGGGYAGFAVIHEDMAMPIPSNLSFIEAAAIPEAFLTAYQALVWLGELKKQDKVLIHAAGSGVGTAAIQIAKTLGAEIIGTASAGKHQICIELGAGKMIDYQEGPFIHKVLKDTEQQGVDVIIDFIGADYFQQNMDCIKLDGRIVLLAAMSGGKISELDLRKILMKRIHIKGSTLRSRSLDYQIKLTKDFFDFAEPLLLNNKIKPVIDKVFDWKHVFEAHTLMESNKNTGKIVLEIN
ncbi:MAG: NAD(P)H-quinone oxidoreductase [Bacteroidota bacterium]|nr:NAD(P)H-quinone oxidoreductase [Bacteroidota bacterium]